MSKLPLLAFNTGEIAPELHHRSDLQKYRSSCKRCENFIVLPQGGVKRRNGSQAIIRIADSDTFTTAREWIWEIDRDNYFIMVFLGSNLYFYTPEGALVETVSHDWDEADFNELYFKQVYDVVFVAHPSYPLKRIQRTAQFTFTVNDHDFFGGPYDAQNIDTSNTMTVTTPVADVATITTVDDTFTAEDVGRSIRMLMGSQSTGGKIASGGVGTASTSLPASGEVNLRTEGGVWEGKLTLQLSIDGGSNWEDIGSIRSEEGKNNAEIVREISEFGALVRAYMSERSAAPSDTGCIYTLEVKDSQYAHFKITGFTDEQTVTVDVQTTVTAGFSTYNWSLGAFCERNGYPACVEVFEERLMLAGVTNSPATLYGSTTNDWNNWQSGTLVTSQIQFTLSNDVRNRIRWMIPESQLVLGTDYGEWTIGTRDTSDILSGENVNAKRQTQYGTDPVQPILSADMSLYIEAGGRRLRSAQYNYEKDGYISVDLSILSNHITENAKFKRIAYTRSPDQIIWCLKSDGQLNAFTFEREHQVSAWARQPFQDAEVIDIASVLQTNGDEIPLIVKRSDGVYLELIKQTNFYFDWQQSFEGITETDVIALPGNEDFTFYGEDLNIQDPPFSGAGVFVWVDIVGASVSDLVIKYDGDILTATEYVDCSKDGNYCYWVPTATNETLITCFDFTTPLNPADFEAYLFSDCYVVDIIPTYNMANIDVIVSTVSVDAKYLYRQEGKQQILVLNQEGIDSADITIEYSAVEIDIDEYLIYQPLQFFSISGESHDIVYIGVQMTSIIEPVDIFNVPDFGGPGTRNRINEIELYLVDSMGGDISTDGGDNYRPVPYLQKNIIAGEPLELQTGKFEVKTIMGSNSIGGLVIRNNSPYKMKIAAICYIGQRLGK